MNRCRAIRIARLICLGVALVALLVGFLVSPSTVSAADAAKAFVRVVHASPSAGPVDVFVDGNKLVSDFTFSKVTGYVPLAAGSYKVQVTPTGKGIQASVITQAIQVSAGVPYTLAALGTTATGFSLEVFADNNLRTAGMAKVRVYHLSPDAGSVKVVTGGTTVIKGLMYRNASNYLSVQPGSPTFQVTATQSNASVPVSATLHADTVNSVFAVGLLNGKPKLQFVLAPINAV